MRLTVPRVLVDVMNVLRLEGECVSARESPTTRWGSRLDCVRPGRTPPRAARYIAHPQIRSRGTFVGSTAHADPSAEAPTVPLTLDAAIDSDQPSSPRPLR